MDVPAPHFLFFLATEFFKLYGLSWFCNATCWMLTASLLLSQEWSWSSSSCSLPGLQELALDWLSVLLFSCLPELTLAAVRSAHRELTTVWSVCGWGAGTVRSAWAQVDGIQWWGPPSGLLVDFLRNLCLSHIFLEFYLPLYQPLPTSVL